MTKFRTPSPTGDVLGVFGGSFDPPHVSHVLAALWALETGEVARVLVMPCARHALGKSLQAPFDDRLEMCRRAFARLGDEVEILDIEGRLGHVSHTIDTLAALDRQRPGHRWRLLIGSDILDETHRWKDWDRIERFAPPLVIPRLTGCVEEAETEERSENSRNADRTAMDLRRLSSSSMRERLSCGEVPLGFVPASVLVWIRERKLYEAGE